MIDDRPVVVRPVRTDGWTPARRLHFLAVLAQCADVSIAARTCRMSRQSAYALRRRDPGFARQWDEARSELPARQEREYLAYVAQLQARAAAILEAREISLRTPSTYQSRVNFADR
jgi:hypothetical protein